MANKIYKDDCYTFEYHPDLFGVVKITNIVTGKSFEVTGNDLLGFIDNFIKEQKIEKLKNARPGDVLEGAINND